MTFTLLLRHFISFSVALLTENSIFLHLWIAGVDRLSMCPVGASVRWKKGLEFHPLVLTLREGLLWDQICYIACLLLLLLSNRNRYWASIFTHMSRQGRGRQVWIRSVSVSFGFISIHPKPTANPINPSVFVRLRPLFIFKPSPTDNFRFGSVDLCRVGRKWSALPATMWAPIYCLCICASLFLLAIN